MTNTYENLNPYKIFLGWQFARFHRDDRPVPAWAGVDRQDGPEQPEQVDKYWDKYWQILRQIQIQILRQLQIQILRQILTNIETNTNTNNETNTNTNTETNTNTNTETTMLSNLNRRLSLPQLPGGWHLVKLNRGRAGWEGGGRGVRRRRRRRVGRRRRNS